MLQRNPFIAPGLILVTMITFLVTLQSCENKPTEPRVLVFSKAKGWKHSCIPFGIAAIQKLGKENNFHVDTTKNSEYFTYDSLKKYHAVIFNSTTRNVLNAERKGRRRRRLADADGRGL